MPDELRIILINEGTVKSIIVDSYTFACLLASLFINARYLGDSWIITCTICTCFFIKVIAYGGRKIKKMSPPEALEYLKKTNKEI